MSRSLLFLSIKEYERQKGEKIDYNVKLRVPSE